MEKYYFYFKDGRIYYLGNTIGGDELRYVFHNGLWYISNGMVINPEGPCIRRAMKLPSQIVSAMRSENYSISSNDYPAYINGSKIYTSNGSVSYVIEIPGNLSINIPDNVTLSSVFLRGGVLLFFRPENPFVPFGWENLTVLYYDGSFLWRLNFTKGIENSLPTCQEESLKFYGVLLTGIILVLVLVYWKAKMG